MQQTVATATEAWLKTLSDVSTQGLPAFPRNQETKELLAYQAAFSIEHPVNLEVNRKLGYHFMAAEAAWILSGDNRLSTIRPYSKEIANFADDGIYFAGAYGPKVVTQISYVVRSLLDDTWSRQAVMTIWQPNPGKTKDYPCTISAQWVIRGGRLHCKMSMRSSDTWLGVPYDWFNFTCITAAILLMLRKHDSIYKALRLGNFFFSSGSQHIYDRNFDDVHKVLNKPIIRNFDGSHPFNVDDLTSVDQLVENLWMLANDQLPTWQWAKDLQEVLGLRQGQTLTNTSST